MAVINNTTVKSDIDNALDIEMVQNFNQDYTKLAEILGIFNPEVIAAGTALYQYTITGSLDSTAYTEGDEVKLSKYTVKKGDPIVVDPIPHRRLTTAKAILQGGYENAVMKTDRKMLNDVRSAIISEFFTYMANGTGTTSASTLQATLANAGAVIADACETNNDAAGSLVYFVNPFDIASYLGAANVTTQTVFGMQYLNGFLGVEHMFVSNKVASGMVFATPIENIHIYGIDFSGLGAAGLEYAASDGSLIGVAHEGAYDRASAATNVMRGAKMLAENLAYIAKGTFPGSASSSSSK